MHDPATITQLLNAAQTGDAAAMDKLFPLVYDELRMRAGKQRAGQGAMATMNTTAIVHEAYLKLADQKDARYANRAHFFAVAAKAMRHVYLDYAKHKNRHKRGGDIVHVDIQDQPVGQGHIEMEIEEAEKVLALEQAIQSLETTNSRLAKVVECRFFGGMTIEDTALAVDASPATVKRDWKVARAMLFKAMQALTL